MALTLVEAAKAAANNGEAFRSGVIEMYARTSSILRVLPFDDISGNALRYNREDILPGVGFRGINESYTESTGILNPITEPLLILGGEIKVDKYITATMGQRQRSTQEALKIKSLAHYFTWAFIKGDGSSDPRQMDGLQARITGNQLLAAGTTSGGDALSLGKLDELIDTVSDPTHLIMNKTMRRRLSAASRSTSVGGFITQGKDEFGLPVDMYGGLPILLVDEDNAGNKILPFTEPAPTGGQAQTTSVYCVSINPGMLSGIQSGPMDVTDLGELQSTPAWGTRIEWYAGITIFHGKAAARLNGITNAAVVA